jgi:hypothetical protein
MSYAYPVSLIIGGVFLGLGLGFIAAAGNRSTFRFAVKEGSFIAAFGAVVIILAWVGFRP